MPDTAPAPEPVPFPVDVTVNGVRVVVTLLLRPGTTVSVAGPPGVQVNGPTPSKPTPARSDPPSRWPLAD